MNIVKTRLAGSSETADRVMTTRSEALAHLAMTDLMARRLTGEATISWRDPKTQTNQPIPG